MECSWLSASTPSYLHDEIQKWLKNNDRIVHTISIVERNSMLHCYIFYL